ncbi:MAG: pyridoxal 5'-phosphate synthase glutaminase subunit PdxT [Candidatus Dormibacteraceae bacterium]
MTPEIAADRAPLIGILALQGAFLDHARALEACGALTRLVRLREDLEGLDGLVIPGGESTTMTTLLERIGMLDDLRASVAGGLPTLATCAGMILLSDRIVDGVAGQRGLGLLDIGVRRNGYGTQLDSFEAPLEVAGIEGGPFPGVFIRAPLVEEAGPGAEVISIHDGRAVGIRQGNVLALCFHPELSGDLRLHREFVHLARRSRRSEAAC